MFHDDSHLNKHGFFEVGDKKFYSKLDAIQYSMVSGHKVSWNFNNKIFSQQDWTTEPTKSIREIYQRRAMDIRNCYDYVIVMFSGGSDSTTVLDSFFKNGIHVDEVLVTHWSKYQPEGMESFMNSEIVHAALPYLEKHAPASTKIRVQDVSDMHLACIRDSDFRQRSYREVNNVHNPGMMGMHYDIKNRYQEYVDTRAKGKSIVFVWGEAKPKIAYATSTGKHYFYFEDHYAHAPQPRDQENPDPLVHHEQFFDDPGYPELKIKQCHLLLKNLKQITHRGDIFLSTDDAWKKQTGPRGFDIVNPRCSHAYTVQQEKKYCLDRNAFNCSIYPDWNFLTYHEDKQAGRLVHPTHQWIETQAGEDVKKWYMGYIETYRKLPDEWTKYYGSLAQGIKRLQIKYYLE
jgi:hypothetical protein